MNVASVLKSKGRSVITTRPNVTLVEIARLLHEKKIGAVVVMGDEGTVAGIFSEHDLVRQIAKHGCDVLNRPVEDFMTRQVVTCEQADTIDDMMDTMTKGRFRHVPVIEDGALVGIVSIGDVVKHHIAAVEMEVTAMRCYLNG